jgi:MFS family permease
MINFYPQLKYPVEVQGFFSGFIALAFWVSMDVLTVKSTESGKRGQQQGSMYTWIWIAGIISPFIGGFIISRFGYSFLFILSLLFVLAGGVLSFFINIEVPVEKKINKLPDFKSANGRHFFLSFFRGFTFSAVAFIFPLFIYEVFSSEIVVGTFSMFFGIASLLATIGSGYLIDKYKLKSMTIILIINTALWYMLGLSLSLYFISILLVLVYYSYSSVNVGLNTLFFNALENQDATTPVSQRIMSFCFGALLLFLAALFFSYYVLFFICSSVCFASIFVVRRLA